MRLHPAHGGAKMVRKVRLELPTRQRVDGGPLGVAAELRSSLLLRVGVAGGGITASFLLTILVVRGLSPRDAAAFFAILAALAIGPLVGRMGLGVNAMRLIPAASECEERRRLAGAHLIAATILSIATAPLLALLGTISLLGRSTFAAAFLLTAALIAIESIRLMVSDIYAGYGRVYASVATTHYVRSILALPFVAAVVLSLRSTSIVGILLIYFVVSSAQFVAALWHARELVSVLALRAAYRSLGTAVRQGLLLFGIDMSEFLVMQGSIWLATYLLEPVAATEYALAVTLGMQIVLFNNLALTAATAPASRLWSTGHRSGAARMLDNCATLATAAALLLLLLVLAAGPWSLGLVYGPDMRPVAGFLAIIAIGGTVQSCFGANTVLLIISDNLRTAVRVALAVLAVTVPAAATVAVVSGPQGLSIVTATSLSAMFVLQYANARRSVGFGVRADRHLRRAVREFLGRRGRGDFPEPTALDDLGGR